MSYDELIRDVRRLRGKRDLPDLTTDEEKEIETLPQLEAALEVAARESKKVYICHNCGGGEFGDPKYCPDCVNGYILEDD